MPFIKKSILLRVRFAFLLACGFAVAIAIKIYHIQFVEGARWSRLSRQTTLDYRKVKATRGNIYSDNGGLLATSIPFYKVMFDPAAASDEVFKEGIDSLAARLSAYYGDRSTLAYKRLLQDARKRHKRYIAINRKTISYQVKKAMSSWPIFEHGRYGGGVIFEKSDVRYRPFSNLAKRTVGFVNENGKGAGLEYSFDNALRGKDGEALFRKISGGVWSPVFDADNIKAIDGLDIQTTLDINLQDVAQTALYRAMRAHDADEGTVVVMEAHTGHIKAISNFTREGNHYYEKFNHAIGGLYEPGSTFKLVTMMALLDEEDIQLSDSIDTGHGVFTVYSHKVRDHGPKGLGMVSVQQAFEQSSNVAMAKLLNRHFGNRPDAFLRYVDKLHLSRPLGIRIVGEGIPKVRRPHDEDWSGIALPWMAYGYGLEVTPLHTLAVYNAVANGGKMVKPMLVTAVSQADKRIERYDTETLSEAICSSSTLNRLRLLLEGVVERGTAHNLYQPHCRIAGKTGTAVMLQDGSYVKKYITSFVGYFPAHRPKYSAIVLIKNPKGWQQYGNNVAGPVFKAIADNIYSRDVRIHAPMDVDKTMQAGVFPVIRAGLQDDLTLLCNELGVSTHSRSEEAWVRAVRNGNSVLWKNNMMDKGAVPDVRGMTFKDALFLLEQRGMTVTYRGIGRVVDQSLAPGARLPKKRASPIRISLQ